MAPDNEAKFVPKMPKPKTQTSSLTLMLPSVSSSLETRLKCIKVSFVAFINMAPIKEYEILNEAFAIC